jgi:hypothetical protein
MSAFIDMTAKTGQSILHPLWLLFAHVAQVEKSTCFECGFEVAPPLMLSFKMKDLEQPGKKRD